MKPRKYCPFVFSPSSLIWATLLPPLSSVLYQIPTVSPIHTSPGDDLSVESLDGEFSFIVRAPDSYLLQTISVFIFWTSRETQTLFPSPTVQKPLNRPFYAFSTSIPQPTTVIRSYTLYRTSSYPSPAVPCPVSWSTAVLSLISSRKTNEARQGASAIDNRYRS